MENKALPATQVEQQSSLPEKVEIEVLRFDPEKDKKPYFQRFVVKLPEKAGMMLLELLHLIKELDPSLSFRRSCGEGVCGSDGMSINGVNGLACITPIASLKWPIRIAPLPGFKIIKDLIVDMTQFFEQYANVKPYLINNEAPPDKERLQSPEDRAKLDGAYECILCACCSSSCPSYWWNPDKFLGPAALLQSYRYIEDSRDMATQERLNDLSDRFKLYRCRKIMNCATVCPKGLNPSEKITKIQDKMLEEGRK